MAGKSKAADPLSLPNRIASSCFFDAKYPLTSKNSPPILSTIESNALSRRYIMSLERVQVTCADKIATDGSSTGCIALAGCRGKDR
jgi:hypothetical protein